MSLTVKEMCIYKEEDKFRLRHCIHRIFLEEPRLYYDEAAKKCGVCRNTVSTYWRDGLKDLIFFPPQIRLNMFENRKEYIYLIQSDSPHKLYSYFQENPDVVYMVYTSGKFDIFLQTEKPLDVLPDRTIFHGSRSNYTYPETPNCTYENALNHIGKLLDQEHSPSKIKVEYPEEPPEVGSSHYGMMIYPYVKYNSKTGYTRIVKKLRISFDSFHYGLEYLLNVSAKLLPYYPKGFRLYSQYFFVFWSNYEEFLCKFLGCLPCHTSITKVKDALIAYVSIEKGEDMSETFFQFCSKMVDLGLIDCFWSSRPIYHWKPDIPW